MDDQDQFLQARTAATLEATGDAAPRSQEHSPKWEFHTLAQTDYDGFVPG